jgi:hypothetical protein
MITQHTRLTAQMKAFALKAGPLLALAAALSSQAFAERLDPSRSVIGNAEDLKVSVNFPKATTGDLYIAVDVGGTLYFYSEQQGWVPKPLPLGYTQTYAGTKQITLGNSNGIPPGIYPIYEIVTTPNAPDVYDTRNWLGGLGSLGQTSFQVKLPAQVSGDFNGDGWADDDANHDGFHDDDANRDGYHDDDLNHTGYHADDQNHDGFHDSDLNHDGKPDNNENNDNGSKHVETGA